MKCTLGNSALSILTVPSEPLSLNETMKDKSSCGWPKSVTIPEIILLVYGIRGLPTEGVSNS